MAYHFPDLLPDEISDSGPAWHYSDTVPLHWASSGCSTREKPLLRTVKIFYDGKSKPLNPGYFAGSFHGFCRRHFRTHEFGCDGKSEGHENSTGPVPTLDPNNSTLSLVPSINAPDIETVWSHDIETRFQPSRVLLGQPRAITQEIKRRAVEAGYNLNSNYLGEVTDFQLSNTNVPCELNCKVFITNIDPLAEDNEIFELFQGKVFAYHRNPPETGKNDTCAVSVTFMEPQPAQRIIAHCRSFQGLVIRGRRIFAKMHREGVNPRPENEKRQSRVFRITGPSNEIDSTWLLGFFYSKVRFVLLHCREWVEGNRKTVEVAFASVYGQSRLAFRLFCMHRDAVGLTGYTVNYAPDPCDQQQNMFKECLFY